MRKWIVWAACSIFAAGAPGQVPPVSNSPTETAHGNPAAISDLGSADPAAIERTLTILANGPPALQTELCRALADDPGRFRSDYLTGSIGMLSSEDAAVRGAAASALAACRLETVAAELLRFVRDSAAPDSSRRAAVDALVDSFKRPRIGALAGAIGTLPAELADYACRRLSVLAGRPLDTAQAVDEWWATAAALDESSWSEALMIRLNGRADQAERERAAIERRLVAALRANFLRAGAEDQPGLLLEYMTDAQPAVRSLGLGLLEASATDGSDPAPGTAEAARLLLSDSSAAVRVSAARAVAAFREPLDEALFLTQLADERKPEVQRALVSALGYVGGDGSVAALLERIRSSNTALAMDSIVALGRIGQRGVLSPEQAAKSAASLCDFVRSGDSTGVELRAAALIALASTGDRSASPELRAALASSDERLLSAAIRGVTLLSAPAGGNGRRLPQLENQGLAAAIMPLTRHPDPGMRRQAVDALGWTAVTSAQLEPLQARISADESDESVRAAAWRALLNGLNRRPWAEWQPWLERVKKGAGPDGAVVQLLEAAEVAAQRDGVSPLERGRIRLELAAAYRAAGDVEKALKAGLAAVGDQAGPDPDAAFAAGRDALRLALLSGRYNAEVAAALNRLDVPSDSWWQVIGPLIEERLRSPTLGEALSMLAALRAAPLGREPERVSPQMDELQNRAQRMQTEAVSTAVRQELVRLREKPDDEGARERIVSLGPAALPPLREALLHVLAAEPPDAEAEQRLLELIRTIQPEWPGYAPELPLPEKRKVVEQLSA